MQNIRDMHNKVRVLIEDINKLTAEKTEGEIIFFKAISIDVSYSSAGGCFSELINWFYALLIEVCGPNIDFFEDRLKVLGISTKQEIPQLRKLVHSIRTVNSHNMDYSKNEDIQKKKYSEDWFINVINKGKPETEDDYYKCAENLLIKGINYLQSIDQALNITVNDEFFEDIILAEWLRRNDRNYGVYEFELVFIEQLKIFGIDNFLDANKLVKREISKWREEIKNLQDGFDFQIEARKIITKYITEKKYSPVDPIDLIENGAPKGNGLIDLNSVICEEFYRNPRSKEDLIDWAKENGLF